MSFIEIIVLLANFHGKKVLLHGIHFGRPPSSEIGVEKTKFILENSEKISIRSENVISKISNYIGKQATSKTINHIDDGYGLWKHTKVNNRNAEFLSWALDKKNSGKKVCLVTARTLYWRWNQIK